MLLCNLPLSLLCDAFVKRGVVCASRNSQGGPRVPRVSFRRRRPPPGDSPPYCLVAGGCRRGGGRRPGFGRRWPRAVAGTSAGCNVRDCTAAHLVFAWAVAGRREAVRDAAAAGYPAAPRPFGRAWGAGRGSWQQRGGRACQGGCLRFHCAARRRREEARPPAKGAAAEPLPPNAAVRRLPARDAQPRRLAATSCSGTRAPLCRATIRGRGAASSRRAAAIRRRTGVPIHPPCSRAGHQAGGHDEASIQTLTST